MLAVTNDGAELSDGNMKARRRSKRALISAPSSFSGLCCCSAGRSLKYLQPLWGPQHVCPYQRVCNSHLCPSYCHLTQHSPVFGLWIKEKDRDVIGRSVAFHWLFCGRVGFCDQTQIIQVLRSQMCFTCLTNFRLLRRTDCFTTAELVIAGFHAMMRLVDSLFHSARADAAAHQTPDHHAGAHQPRPQRG